jgi:hypothetical protein
VTRSGDPVYKQWIRWSYEQRLAVWDLNNEVTRRAGGPDCLWIGMNGGEVVAQSKRLRDDVEICERGRIFLLDSQWRHEDAGFQANADTGKRLHGMLGTDVLIPESTAMYDAGVPTFRLGSKPGPEARMWAIEGWAGGIQPWWHHIGSVHDDRRQYATAQPLFEWHEQHEEFLVDREPVATVGLLWSQRSVDFHGKDAPEEVSQLPYRGWVDALIRARIPYLPTAVVDERFAVLVVPNVGVLTDEQVARLAAYVRGGGKLVVTGESGLYDEWGIRRGDWALGDLLGVRHAGKRFGDGTVTDWENYDSHSYLRIEDPSVFDGDTEDCQLYRQGDRYVLHLVNLDQGGAWRGRLEEFTPAGPFTVALRASGRRARFLVSGGEVEVKEQDGWITVEVDRITDHEVVVLE